MSKKTLANLAVVLGLALAVAGVVSVKQRSGDQPAGFIETTAVSNRIPTLVDLGAGKCIPCKKMAPILDALREEYAGQFKVVFHDVWKDPEPGRQYGIRLIPTQIFLDPDGKELFRHEGFFSREDILREWKALGYPFEHPEKT